MSKNELGLVFTRSKSERPRITAIVAEVPGLLTVHWIGIHRAAVLAMCCSRTDEVRPKTFSKLVHALINKFTTALGLGEIKHRVPRPA